MNYRLEQQDKKELIDIILEKEERLKEKDAKIKKLEKELAKYKNPNTPSSSNKHLKPNTQGLRKKKNSKRGAPKGHTGTNRKQNIDKHEIVDTDECSKCHNHNVKDYKIFNRVVEETPEPIKPETKHVEIHRKRCLDCGHIFIPEHNTTPLHGKFGVNIMVLVIFLKFLLRGVLRKTACFLESSIALKLTPATVNSIIARVANAADDEYDALKQRIRQAYIVYVDETSFSVLGKNQWVWVFRTANDILLVIRPSRGSNVLEEILGADYSGNITCDCWRAYNFLTGANIQRCWAHLLRKSEKLCEFVAGKHFHDKLTTLFAEIKEFKEEQHTQDQRDRKYLELTNKLKNIIDYYSRYDEFTSVVKYIRFNLNNWFTCIKVEGMEPTNNFAEQAIRETVMVRKIIGAFRSESGKQNYETLASVIASWQMQNRDLKAELKRMLTKNMCFC